MASVGASITGFGSQHRQLRTRESVQGGLSSAAAALSVVRQAQAAEGENSFSYEEGRLVANIYQESPGVTIHHQADLTIDTTAPDGEASASVKIDGNIDVYLKASHGEITTTVSYKGNFDELLFDPAQCATDPISGSIRVVYDVEITGLPAGAPDGAVGGAGPQSGTVVATYGPACGDILIEGT